MNQHEKQYPRKALLLLSLLLAILLSTIVWWNRPLPAPANPMLEAENLQTGTEGVAALAQGMSGIEAQAGWHYDAGELPPVSPVIAGEWVYLIAGTRLETGRVIALDLRSGQLRWQRPLGGVALQAPLVAGDLLFVGVSQGTVLALDRTSGETLWTAEVGAPFSGHLALAAGVLFVGADGIRAFDATTGEQRWHHTSESRITQPLVYGDGVIVGVEGHQFTLLDTENGQRRLAFPLWFNPTGGLAISGQTVAVTGSGANVQALHLQGHSQFLEPTLRFWQTRLWLYGMGPAPPLPSGYAWQNRTSNGLSAQTAGADDRRFFLSRAEPDRTGRLVALENQQGTTLWEQGFSILLAPGATMLGQVVVVGLQDGRIVAVRRDSGQLVWTQTMAEPILAAPVFGGNLMVTSLASGTLQAMVLASPPDPR